MRWIEAVIATKSEEIDALCLRLTDLGIEGVSIEDEKDFKEFLENNHTPRRECTPAQYLRGDF